MVWILSLLHLLLNSGPFVLSDAAHPISLEMEKTKISTDSPKRGVVPYTSPQTVLRVWFQRTTASDKVVSLLLVSNFRTEPKLRCVSCGGGLWCGHYRSSDCHQVSEPADCEPQHCKKDPNTDEFAGGPGNGTASGERPPLLCFALVLVIIWSDK